MNIKEIYTEKIVSRFLKEQTRKLSDRFVSTSGKITRVGIDMGSNSIKMVSYHNENETDRSQLGLIELVNDENAYFQEEISETHFQNGINGFLKELSSEKLSIRVCLSSTMNNVFILNVPQVEMRDLNKTINWELSPLLPEPVDMYQYDYQILNNDDKEKKITLLIGLFEKDRIRQIIKLAGGINRSIDILETDTLSALDIFLNDFEEIEESIGFLQLGSAHSNYVILSPDQYPRYLFIPFGGNTLNDVITQQKGFSFFDAENFRRKNSTKMNSGQEEDSYISDLTLDHDIHNALHNFANTIIQFNIHHETKTDQSVKKIYLTGGLLNDERITQTFQQSPDFFQVPCEFWDPLEKYIPKEIIKPSHQFLFSSALGLALK